MKTNYNKRNTFSKTLLLCAALITGLSGCKKDYLAPDPLSIYIPETTFNTKGGLDAAMAMCDKTLRAYWTYYEYQDLGLPISTDYIFSDVAVASKTDDGNIFIDIATRLTPTDQPERVGYFWSEAFNGVKYANTILNNIDNVTGISDTTKNEYKGRALFHRAFHYMGLVFRFKDVPLITRILTGPKVDYKSTKREAILQMLTQDLENAVQWVPDQVKMTLIGLVNKASCRQLLLKCYLATGQWDKAIGQADTLINNSGLSLMTSNFGTFVSPYATTWPVTRNVIWDLHRPENKGILANKETILLMANRNNTDMGIKMNSMRNWCPFLDNISTTYDGQKQAVRYFAQSSSSFRAALDYKDAIGRGIAHIRPTYFHQNSLWYVNGVNDAGDLRHNSTVGNWARMDSLKYNDPAATGFYGKNLRLYNGSTLLCTDTIRNWFDWPHYKYYIEDVNETGNVNELNHRGGAGDLYCYRLAETYLLRAEAKFYKGDIAGATADVNRIRQRAQCTQLYAAVSIGDIMDERARELNMEEFRFAELSRVSYSLALSGKSDEWGNTYQVEDLAKNSYWFQRLQHDNEFYNKGKVMVKNRAYTIAAKNINWPVPQTDINANGGNPLRQNEGYSGYDAGISMWTDWHDAVADELPK
ncbi:starch-binding protein [Niastella yeongjuensis]|uniref:Starch-binding protein n=1 Tax=Niastella yeongjuensis TaxID=354355 RepID=A0A1V9EEB3_9BACT|nr:RagB/SusD family nutrient uptake outer membrane protein [Niastella yeongjuensis]OQP44463.1 starch-binding protein [Niastella yeongjuensis]SEO86841.1 Starch-binding associating with outer membrane [Niastella yeongjuensis]